MQHLIYVHAYKFPHACHQERRRNWIS